MTTDTVAHRHTIRSYIPTLTNITGALRLAVAALEEAADSIDPELSPGNDPGTDPAGAETLQPVVEDLYKAVIALAQITGDNYVSLLETYHDGPEEVEEVDDESKVQPVEVK